MIYTKIYGFIDYMVTNTGQVISTKRDVPKKLKLNLNTKGYYKVNLWDDGRQYTKEVHILVWDAFGRQDREGYTIDHKDNNKLNNNIDNMQLLSNRENVSKGYLLKEKTSKYTGVRKVKSGWRADIKHNNKKIYLGVFGFENEASIAYQSALKVIECL